MCRDERERRVAASDDVKECGAMALLRLPVAQMKMFKGMTVLDNNMLNGAK